MIDQASLVLRFDSTTVYHDIIVNGWRDSGCSEPRVGSRIDAWVVPSRTELPMRDNATLTEGAPTIVQFCPSVWRNYVARCWKQLGRAGMSLIGPSAMSSLSLAVHPWPSDWRGT